LSISYKFFKNNVLEVRLSHRDKLAGSLLTDRQRFNLRGQIKCVNIINKINKVLADKYKNSFGSGGTDDDALYFRIRISAVIGIQAGCAENREKGRIRLPFPIIGL
jgi:hypothetical protein